MELPSNQKVVFFAPHPDDDVLSAGATLYEMKKKGNEVETVFLSLSPKGVIGDEPEREKAETRRREAIAACNVLGIKPSFLDWDEADLNADKSHIEGIARLLKQKQPDIIFLPPANDAHPAHKATHMIIKKALKSQPVKEIWYYETWTLFEQPNFIFFFDEDVMKKKMEACLKHASQMSRVPFHKALAGLNKFRGILGQELMGKWGESYKEMYGEAFIRH